MQTQCPQKSKLNETQCETQCPDLPFYCKITVNTDIQDFKTQRNSMQTQCPRKSKLNETQCKINAGRNQNSTKLNATVFLVCCKKNEFSNEKNVWRPKIEIKARRIDIFWGKFRKKHFQTSKSTNCTSLIGWEQFPSFPREARAPRGAKEPWLAFPGLLLGGAFSLPPSLAFPGFPGLRGLPWLGEFRQGQGGQGRPGRPGSPRNF